MGIKHRLAKLESIRPKTPNALLEIPDKELDFLIVGYERYTPARLKS